MKNIIDTIDVIEDGQLLPSHEEVRMTEDELLRGLFEAADFKQKKEFQKLIQIKRNGKLLFEFSIRPLSEDEVNACRRKATKKIPNPSGKQYPTIDGDTDYVKIRSYKILTATIDEDLPKIWGNKKLKESINTMNDIDVVDTLLMAGEKDWIADVIDEISGYGISREEYTKN